MKRCLNRKARILAFLLFFVAVATAQVWDGGIDTTWYTSNKFDTKYTITTPQQLAGLARLVNGVSGTGGNGAYNMEDKTIKLGNDIVLNETDGWESWETTPPANTWTAIGNYDNSFRGIFDGDGHVVSGVYINTISDYQGLFGYLRRTIKNIGVVDSYIKGGSYVGGLVGGIAVGYSTVVINSYSTGTVTGSGSCVGGLAGQISGTVSNSYSTGAVTGDEFVGGLIGSISLDSWVRNNYSTGAVTGSGSYVGGLVGSYNGTSASGILSNSYYDTQTSGQTGGNGIGKTTAEMQSQGFTNLLNIGAGISSMNAWVYSEGKYPELTNTLASAVTYFASGDGTETNPYVITTKEQLEAFSIVVNAGNNFNGKYFELGNDIALNDTMGWREWETTPPICSWTAIGNYTGNKRRSFDGTFDGNGYVISGVYINTTNNYQGLFGYVNGGTIKNLGVVISYIKGGSYVGGLVGYNEYGTVSNSYFIGAVGNLVGYNYNSTVFNSYFVRVMEDNSISGTYYYSTGQGETKTTSEMQNKSFANFLNIGAGILSMNAWVYSEGEYPELTNTPASAVTYFASGEGTETNPYVITTKEQLETFSVLVNSGTDFNGKYFELGNDIALNNTATSQWITIGIYYDSYSNYNRPFRGTFDGNGHTISGVYINNDKNYRGLCGYLGGGGTIKNLGVINSSINGGSYIGGLAGINVGTISNSYFTGTITGISYVGGLVGTNFSEYGRKGTISNSYSISTVIGSNYVGGLVGYNSNGGTVTNSYSAGTVTGTGSNVGGLIGSNYGLVSNGYYDKIVSKQTDIGKGIGKTTAEIQSESFATLLNAGAGVILGNAWVYSGGKYPVLSNEPASANILDYFVDGDGTETSPYIITTKEHLEILSSFVNAGKDFNSEHFKLGNDIALNDTTSWQNWGTTSPANSWTAIGSNTNQFKGTFDGDGHVISGVYINNEIDYQGLFGYLGSGGTIKNLGVINSSIKGGGYIGGLVGYNYDGGTVSNSYSTSVVIGISNVGGLMGCNWGTVTNSYSIGAVTGSGTLVGGLVGYNFYGTIINSFYDTQTSGQTDTGKGEGKTTIEMQSEGFVNLLNIEAGLLSMNAWVYSEGKYPELTNTPASTIVATYFSGGEGTEANPYIITTKEQLEVISLWTSKGINFNGEYFKLGNDIALNDTTNWQNWETTSPANSWTAIGSNTNQFKGTFDGDDYVVSGVYINNDKNYQSLFGYLGEGGTIKNLGVVNSYIKGGNYVGGLVGYIYSDGSIINSYSTGAVMGSDYVGGLVGHIYRDGSIINSYSTCAVTGSNYVGGLVGNNEGSKVSNSYSTGAVTGNGYVGGLVGQNYYTNAKVINSYSTGTVTGSSNVGGLVGGNSGSVSNSYYDKTTSGRTDIGRGVGKTTAEMQSRAFVYLLNKEATALSMNAWVYSEGKYPELTNTLAHTNITDYFAGGDGTEANPYIISTKEHLENFSYFVILVERFNEKYFKLGNDIALNDTENWQNWGTTPSVYSWTAIGNSYSNSFLGTFDGDGHVVSGIYINGENGCQGLFGYLGEGGTIKNLGVVNSYIKGGQYVGGLVGCNYNQSTVVNSYSMATVTGNEYVGGLVGSNSGTVRNSYFAGTISGNSNVGDLVGYNYYGGTVSNSYYDIQISGQTDIGKGEGKTTIEMQSEGFANLLNIEAGLLSMNAWVYSEGKYPELTNTSASAIVATYFSGGDGTEANPYIITTKEQLEVISIWASKGIDFSGEYFKLGNDIALNDTTGWQNWGTTPPAYSWTAIGTNINYSDKAFRGTFDGNGYFVSGIYINTTSDNQGLFGYLGEGGVIKNVGIVGSYVKGGSNVGGLVGVNRGTVSNSYSTGTVTGNDYVGGLVGSNYGTASNSYATGAVIGSGNNVGGLVGYVYNYGGTVSNSYYDKETSGQTGGYGTGKTTAEMKQMATYANWDFQTIWGKNNSINNGYPYLRMSVDGYIEDDKDSPTLTHLDYEIPEATYNSAPQSIGEVTGAEGIGEITVFYNGSTEHPTNAGTYTVTAQIAEGTAFTAATITLGDFTIAKATHNIDHISFDHMEVVHSGDEICYDLEHNGDLDLSMITYDYENHCHTAVSEDGHTVTIKFTSLDPNYHHPEDMTALLKIAAAQTPTIPNRVNPSIGSIGVQTISGGIVLTNLPQNAKVEVYNLNGKRIYSSNPGNPKILKIQVQTKGTYIVRVNSQTVRVAVR